MTADDFCPFLTPLIRCFISAPLLIRSDLPEPPLPPTIWRHICMAPYYKYLPTVRKTLIKSVYLLTILHLIFRILMILVTPGEHTKLLLMAAQNLLWTSVMLKLKIWTTSTASNIARLHWKKNGESILTASIGSSLGNDSYSISLFLMWI